jgi:hypothetical protein
MKDLRFLVQFFLPNNQCQDTEFDGTRFEIDRGSLLIYGHDETEDGASAPKERLLLAFAPGIWRAVCGIDATTGYPLLPAYPRPTADEAAGVEAPAEETPPAPRVEAAPAATEQLAAPPRQSGESPFSSTQQSAKDAKRARIEQLAAELDKAPYMGLDAFCTLTGASRQEAEWALCAALVTGRLKTPELEEREPQQLLVQHGEETLARAGSPKLGAFAKALAQNPALAGVDLVQAQIWLLRRANPQA